MIREGARAIRDMYRLTQGIGNLRVMMMSSLVGSLGAGLLNPVLPVFLRGRGLDTRGIGLVYTLGSLLPIFLQPLLGAWSDRHGRRRIVIGISLTTSLLVPALALLHSPVPVAAAIALKLLLSRSALPVSGALVADSAPEQQRATVFALLDSAVTFMLVAALLASSAMVRWLSTERLFFLAGGLFLAGSSILFLLQEPRVPSHAAGRAGQTQATWRLMLAGLWAPVGYVRRRPSLAGLFAFQFFFTFALNLYPLYIPLYAMDLGAPQELLGPLVASSWLVFAVVQPLGGRLSDRLPQRGGLILAGLAGMAGLGLAMGSIGWLHPPHALAVLVAAWALLAVPDGLFRPALCALSVELAPAHERGRFMGALGSCATLAQALAPVTYGLVAHRFSLSFAFLVSAGAFLLALASMSRVPDAFATRAAPLHPSSDLG